MEWAAARPEKSLLPVTSFEPDSSNLNWMEVGLSFL
jgi:hypothetical protein